MKTKVEKLKDELQDTNFLDQIYEHILKSAIAEIKAYHRANKKFFKNREEFAEYVGATDSMIQKILAKKIKQKSIASIETLLKLCDKIGIPIKIDYEIGLHTCYYQSKGYINNKRNIHSNRYEAKKLSVSEIKRRVKNGEPRFLEYVPKIIPLEIGDQDIFVDLETIDDEKELKNLLKYEKALNALVKTIR